MIINFLNEDGTTLPRLGSRVQIPSPAPKFINKISKLGMVLRDIFASSALPRKSGKHRGSRRTSFNWQGRNAVTGAERLSKISKAPSSRKPSFRGRSCLCRSRAGIVSRRKITRHASNPPRSPLRKAQAAPLGSTNCGHRRDRLPNSHPASAGTDFTVASMVGTDKRAAPRCHVGRAAGPKSTQESVWRHDWGPQPNSGIGFAWRRRVNF